MDIDLRLPSGEHEKEEKEETKEIPNMMDSEHKMHIDDVLGHNIGVNSPSIDMDDF